MDNVHSYKHLDFYNIRLPASNANQPRLGKKIPHTGEHKYF